MSGSLVVLIIVVVIVGWAVLAYNGLVSLRNQVKTPGGRSTFSSSAGMI